MQIKTTNFLLKNPYVSPNPDSNLSFIYPALQEFKKLKTPARVAYNIIKSIGAVEQAMKQCDDTSTTILKSLCDNDENGNPISESGKYKFSENNLEEFNNKIQDLLNSEITIDIFPINQSDISNIPEVNIQCYETLMIHGFINDDTVQVEKPILNGKATKKELESIGE